jgi:predicted RNase H-like HicB family nuclease
MFSCFLFSSVFTFDFTDRSFLLQLVTSDLLFQSRSTRDIIELAMKTLKFVVEKHRDGYVAYPLGLKGAVVGEGDTYDSALADAKSAAAFHVESFGKEAFEDEDEVMEAFIAEASLATG